MSKKTDKDGPKKAKKAKKGKAAQAASDGLPAADTLAADALAEQTRLRAEVTVLRLLVDRMLLVQARHLGKEAYLDDLHDLLMGDLDRLGLDSAGPEAREVMHAAIERSLEAVRAQLLLARADSSKRN